MSDDQRDAEFLAAIGAAESNAYGADGDSTIDSERARAIDDYLGLPYGNEVEGRSQIMSRDVYDTIEWIKPSLLRIFTAGDEIAKFDPVSPEDEAVAEQETDYINYVILDKNNWFSTCYEWFTDALNTKNAYCLAYWDTSKQIESERYSGLSDDEMALLMNDQAVDIVQHTAVTAPYQQPQMPGVPVPPPQTLHDVVIRREREYEGVKLCVLPPERCLVSQTLSGMSVRNADFFEYWELKTISEVRAMGFDIPDDISDDGRGENTEEDQSRDQFDEFSRRHDSLHADPASRKVMLRCLWIKYDYDGDGLAEMRRVMCIGDTILFNEEDRGVDVACIVPTPLSHRHPGLSVRDMVHDLQKIKTTIMRQMLDNLYLANNGRYGVSDKVNLDDMLTSRPGGVVRVRGGLPAQEIMPITHPVIGTPALEMVGYLDSVRESRTGTSRALNQVDPNVLQKGISGVAVAQMYSAAGQRIEMIARVFAEGIKELFLIVHELCIKNHHKQAVVKLRNRWVTVNPSEWRRRTDMRISVGLGTGNKEQLMANLSNILAEQKQAMALGLTTPKHIYNTYAEYTKAAGFSSAAKFWTEPPEGMPLPPPDPSMIALQTQVQMESLKQQEQTKRTQMEIESRERIELAKLAAEREQKMIELQTKHEPETENGDDSDRAMVELQKQREKIAHDEQMAMIKAANDAKIAAINGVIGMFKGAPAASIDAVIAAVQKTMGAMDGNAMQQIGSDSPAIDMLVALLEKTGNQLMRRKRAIITGAPNARQVVIEEEPEMPIDTGQGSIERIIGLARRLDEHANKPKSINFVKTNDGATVATVN